MLALTRFSHLEFLLKTWVDKYRISIVYDRYSYSVGDHAFLREGCPNVLGAFVVFTNGDKKIFFNFNEDATDQELLTVLLHEIGHFLDSNINPDKYTQLASNFRSFVWNMDLIRDVETTAWKIAIAEANKIGFKLDHETIKKGLLSYGVSIEQINELFEQKMGGI